MANLIVRAYQNWRERHRNKASFILHLFGIPACFVVTPVLLILQQWLLAAAFFVGGYILQFIGHWIEGNPPGEALLLRKIFKKQ